MSWFSRDRLWFLVTPVLLLLVVLVRVHVADQWDFNIYYFGAAADRSGLSPYDAAHLTAMAGGKTQYVYPYMYPPPTVALFKPFAALSLGSAKLVWLVLKLAALVGLITLWQKRFIPREAWPAWVLLLAFGFNSALVRDVRSGNFGLFEELVLWGALTAFLARRYWLFCGLILATAFFKLTPLLLLGLLFLAPVRQRYRYVGVSLAVFAALLGLSWASSPADFLRWVANVSQHDEELGTRNPCTLSLFRQIAEYVSSPDTAAQWKRIADVFYVVTAGGVGWLTLRPLWQTRRTSLTEQRQQLLLGFALTAYALMLPRFMIYTYVLLLVPAFFVTVRHRKALVTLVALTLMHAAADKLLGIEWIPETDPFWAQASPLLLIGIWLGYLIVNYFPIFLSFWIWATYRRELAEDLQPVPQPARVPSSLAV